MDRPSGAFGYQNWLAFRAGKPEWEANEVSLYSDCRFTGELREETAPFFVLNTTPVDDPGTLRLSLVLRVSWHSELDPVRYNEIVAAEESDTSRFFGGSAYDEIVSLLSLTHGARLHAGGVIRTFFKHGDPRGKPEPDYAGPVVLNERGSGTVLPGFARTVGLDATILSTYPTLSWDTGLQILRAARSYQQATWIADSDPNLAWLLLVSAVETAANEWNRLTKVASAEPADILAAVNPEFAERLKAAAGLQAPDVLAVVGREIGGVLRSRQKFLSFLGTFAPDALPVRPAASYQVDWSPDALRQAFDTIYKLRSKALHASEPFPMPMCRPPRIGDVLADGTTIAAERPFHTEFSGGGLWRSERMPMHFHIFEHITRHALLGFWRAIVARAPNAPVT